MVTRTFELTTYTVMCCRTDTMHVELVDFRSLVPPHSPKALAALQEKHDTDNFKLVQIVNTKTAEEQYAMPEEDFIFYATRLEK